MSLDEVSFYVYIMEIIKYECYNIPSFLIWINEIFYTGKNLDG